MKVPLKSWRWTIMSRSAAGAALCLLCCSPPSGLSIAPFTPDLAGANDGGAPDLAGAAARIRVHLPDDSAVPSLRGAAPLSWERGAAMTKVAPGIYELALPGLATASDFKPLLGDRTWSLGQNYRVHPGQTLEICPHFTPGRGVTSRRWPDGTSTPLGDRGVWVYLPQSAANNLGCRYPVLYMHDGQNLFDPRAAFGGVTWRVAETLDAGANSGDPAAALPEIIVVGVENGGAARINEYTPVPDDNYGGGGGDAYLRFLSQIVKPFIDRSLPTRPDDTALAGSSLGGLITAHAGLTLPQVFPRLGILSPSTWWNKGWLIGQVKARGAAARVLRVYVDSGDSGPSQDDVENTRKLADAYRQAGYRDEAAPDELQGALLHVVQAGGQHSESDWAQRLPAALRFLLKGL